MDENWWEDRLQPIPTQVTVRFGAFVLWFHLV